MNKQTQISVWYFLAALVAVLWLREIWVESRQVASRARPDPASNHPLLRKASPAVAVIFP